MATMKNQFKCTQSSMRYIFKTGKTAAFSNFCYYTDVKSEIDELNAEIAEGHPVFFVDKDHVQVDMDTLDPLADIKKQMKEEARAEILRDMGVTNSGLDMAAKLAGIASTKQIGKAAADSSSK